MKKSFKRRLENSLDEGWDFFLWMLLLLLYVFDITMWLKVFNVWQPIQQVDGYGIMKQLQEPQ